MKCIILILSIVTGAASFAASPAATQQWVKNYVSTNTAEGGGVSAQWVIDLLRTSVVNTASSAVTQTDAAANALALALYENERSGLRSLMFAQATTNGNDSVKMADTPNGNGWTNVVAGCGVRTNGAHNATLTVGANAYVCGSFYDFTARNDFARISGGATNIITVWCSSISTNEWKAARGEN